MSSGLRSLILIGVAAVAFAGCGGADSGSNNADSESAVSSEAAGEENSAQSKPPSALIAKLEQCEIPSFELVQTAVSNYGQFNVEDVEFDPAPDPPYRVAPNYASPVNSCGYVDGDGDSTMFAADWTTDAQTIKEWVGPDKALDLVNPKPLDPPEHAVKAVSTDVSTVIAYPGLAFRWSRVAVRDRVDSDAQLTADAKAIQDDVINALTACFDDKQC